MNAEQNSNTHSADMEESVSIYLENPRGCLWWCDSQQIFSKVSKHFNK